MTPPSAKNDSNQSAAFPRIAPAIASTNCKSRRAAHGPPRRDNAFVPGSRSSAWASRIDLRSASASCRRAGYLQLDRHGRDKRRQRLRKSAFRLHAREEDSRRTPLMGWQVHRKIPAGQAETGQPSRIRLAVSVMSDAVTIDARGLRCPLPTLRLRKVLLRSPTGTIVRILTDDPVATVDIPHFCREEGYDLVAEQQIGTGRAFTVEKA